MPTPKKRQPRQRLLDVVYRLNLRDNRRADNAETLLGGTEPEIEPRTLAELRKLNAEVIKTYLSLIGPITVAGGIIAVFLYTFFISHSFPSGLTAGDTVFFGFIALGFALCSFAISLSGLLCFLPWINRLQARAPRAPHSDIKFFNIASDTRKVVEATNGKLTAWATASLLLFSIAMAIAFRNGTSLADTGHPEWLALTLRFFICPVLAISAFWLAFMVTDKGTQGNRRSPGIVGERVFISLAPFAPALLFIIGFANLPFAKAAFLFAGILLGSISFSFAIDLIDSIPLESRAAAKHRKMTCLLFFVFSFASPFLAGGISGQVSDIVMQKLGLYSEHTTILVDKAALAALQAYATENGQPLYSCKINENWASVSDVQVWWNSVGTKTYVELSGNSANSMNTMLPVTLDSSNVKVAGHSNGVCVETNTGIYFDSDKAAFNSPVQVENQLRDLFAQVYDDSRFSCNRRTIYDHGTIVITGHSDPMPRSTGNNAELSLQRACATYRYLRDDLKFLIYKQTLIGEEIDTTANDHCTGIANRKDRIACEEAARYVNVRILTGSSHLNVPGTSEASNVCAPATPPVPRQ